uniref:Uncharacterized protein n=1 Tax=Euplotes harpa TaxID=151035 RepID=A0A7S3J3S5_9SPIT|mmetsp:Transcript_18394/g.21144  ORF Transcript_18394/g.21144 Transcript_18394/m.21144 type:complete len:131 (+) Transcript_18394:181-573(+)
MACGFRYDSKCQKVYDTLFIVFLIYIVIFRIPLTLIKLYSISYLGIESRAGYFWTIVSEVFQLSWAIYANIVYYGGTNTDCKFYVAAGIFMLYVYYVMYKVCIFILVAIILIPCFLVSYIIESREKAKEK